MNKIDFFKLQAKNLHKDYKTGTPKKRFPIDYRRVLNDFYAKETDVNNFTLMKAQHIIAVMVGFNKWADLIKTSEEELEKRRLWFEKTKGAAPYSAGKTSIHIANKIDFFKLQAKNLYEDFKTQEFDPNEELYVYSPKHFDVDEIIVSCDLDEDNDFSSLTKVQDLFAEIMLGFESWNDLINATEAELKLAKALYDNQHKISLDEWDMYIARVENENNISLDAKGKLEIFKNVFADVDGHRSAFLSYKL